MPYTFQVTRTFSFTEDYIYEIKWHGTGGRTVSKARAFDLGVEESFRRDTVILQLGSNDFAHGDPLWIASAIVELVTLLHNSFLVKFVSAKPFIEYRALHLISEKLSQILESTAGATPLLLKLEAEGLQEFHGWPLF